MRGADDVLDRGQEVHRHPVPAVLVVEIDLNTCAVAGIADLIDARAASQSVQPGQPADQNIVTGAAVEEVVAAAAFKTIGGRIADHIVRMRGADDVLDRGQEVHRHPVPAVLVVEIDLNTCAVAGIADLINAFAASQSVQPGQPADQDIVTGAAVEDIVAAAAFKTIGRRIAGQIVRMRGADDVLDG